MSKESDSVASLKEHLPITILDQDGGYESAKKVQRGLPGPPAR